MEELRCRANTRGLEWADWYNNRRLLEPIGDMPPAEKELAYYRQQDESAIAA